MKDVLKHNWINRMTEAMCMTHPDVERDKIERMVTKIYDQRVKDHKVQLYNNYENTIANTSLLHMVDWFQTRKPLIAESGVYFYPKSERRNVNTEIIKECMLDARTIHKKEKFDALEAGDVFLASVKDIQQANDKKAANSGYGAEGESSSFLYNIHSAMSVTACGRGQISTACQCFENLLADNVKFFQVSEFFNWVYNIVHEQPEWEFDTFDVIPIVPSRDEFIQRFMRKFGHESLANETIIGQVYDYLDDELRIRVYYKANLLEFLKWRRPSDLLRKIAFAKVEFVDPNKIPKEIEKPLEKLTNMVMEFVGYKYSIFRYEDRLKYQKRAVTILIDTDSNILYYGGLYQKIVEDILPVKFFKSKKEKDDFKLRVLNTLSDFSTKAITKTLHHYLGVANVAEDDRKHVKMKNEFYYTTIVITYAKKSYVGLQARQEAVIFDKPKLDVKGVNFFKSTASEDTSNFIYDEILMNQLLQPKDGEISLRRTFSKIQEFQTNMRENIQKGNMGYLKRSIRVKTPDAYANPLRIGQYKAVYVWNKVADDKDRIDLPSTVTLVKVQLRNKQDVAKLENWPKIYEKMMKLFETDPEIGDYEEDGKMKKGKGIKAIALPDTYDEVPDWLLAIIDTDTLVNDNMKLFSQLFRPLGMVPGTVNHSGTTLTYYTNIVRI